MASTTTPYRFPERFAELKRDIAASYPNFQERATKAWNEILIELERVTALIAKEGSNYIPQVKFSDLENLSKEDIDRIKRSGSVVIQDIVDDEEAEGWKSSLEEIISNNPDVVGFPKNDKQFFELYWTKPQVQARAHPNVLAASAWLNNLYHANADEESKGVDLSTALTYADRFRIRHPGGGWNMHPPHIDGGTIERWEEPSFRKCFADILAGDWRSHDPYALDNRLNARTSIYGRPNQSTVFRTFQGWLAMSETAPGEGTLKVFPDVLLSNAYITLRPFFRATVPTDAQDIYDGKNWVFDVTDSEFPGIIPRDGGYAGPKPTPLSHPHLRLNTNMTSVPKVNPGDAVFWHCDVVHAVEVDHHGSGDSAVMYIPAVPLTPKNQLYVEKQKQAFLNGLVPPDFPQEANTSQYAGIGGVEDIVSASGKRAMGFAITVS